MPKQFFILRQSGCNTRWWRRNFLDEEQYDEWGLKTNVTKIEFLFIGQTQSNLQITENVTAELIKPGHKD